MDSPQLPNLNDVRDDARATLQLKLRQGKDLAQAATFATLDTLPEWNEAWLRAYLSNPLPPWQKFYNRLLMDWKAKGPLRRPPLPVDGLPRPLLRGEPRPSSRQSVVEINRVIRAALAEDHGLLTLTEVGEQVGGRFMISRSVAGQFLQCYTTPAERRYLRATYASHVGTQEPGRTWQRVVWVLVAEAMPRHSVFEDCMAEVETQLGMENLKALARREADDFQLATLRRHFRIAIRRD
jgi:hypothetical protein